jgi:DNA-binding transcriptional regulator LsrR (DeoR family)
LAERTGAEAYVMPVPMFANTAEDRTVLLGQKGIREVFDLARSADLLFAGIGTAEREASLVATGMIEKGEMEEIRRNGGVGELLGHFFDEAGKAVATTVSNRAMALTREDIASRRIVAVAGGKIKVRAIKAVLEGRYLKGLITDERTARSLVEETPVG